MKVTIRYSSKVSKWIVNVDKWSLASLEVRGCIRPGISRPAGCYLQVAKVLRQFGLTKPVKNNKAY